MAGRGEWSGLFYKTDDQQELYPWFRKQMAYCWMQLRDCEKWQTSFMQGFASGPSAARMCGEGFWEDLSPIAWAVESGASAISVLLDRWPVISIPFVFFGFHTVVHPATGGSVAPKKKKKRLPLRKASVGWSVQDLNLWPLACQASALNQLS